MRAQRGVSTVWECERQQKDVCTSVPTPTAPKSVLREVVLKLQTAGKLANGYNAPSTSTRQRRKMGKQRELQPDCASLCKFFNLLKILRVKREHCIMCQVESCAIPQSSRVHEVSVHRFECCRVLFCKLSPLHVWRCVVAQVGVVEGAETRRARANKFAIQHGFTRRCARGLRMCKPAKVDDCP